MPGPSSTRASRCLATQDVDNCAVRRIAKGTCIGCVGEGPFQRLQIFDPLADTREVTHRQVMDLVARRGNVLEPQKGAHILEWEPKFSASSNKLEPRHVADSVTPMATGCTARLGHDADLFVVTDGFDLDPGAFCEGSDRKVIDHAASFSNGLESVATTGSISRPMETTDLDSRHSRGGGAAASGGIIAGVLAAIGASCCVLPLVLIQLGVSAAIAGRLTALAAYQPWFMLLAAGLLGWAAFRAFRGGRPRRRVLVLLALGVIIVAAAFVLPAFERDLLRWAQNL